MGIDGTASIGFWKQPFETGGTQGATTSVSGVVSIGGGVWYTDFDPEAKAQEERAGFTLSAGIGLGVEYGEYHEVGTKVFGPVPVTLPVICPPRQHGEGAHLTVVFLHSAQGPYHHPSPLRIPYPPTGVAASIDDQASPHQRLPQARDGRVQCDMPKMAFPV